MRDLAEKIKLAERICKGQPPMATPMQLVMYAIDIVDSQATRPEALLPSAWLYEETGTGTHRAILFERATSGMYHHGPFKETPLYAGVSPQLLSTEKK